MIHPEGYVISEDKKRPQEWHIRKSGEAAALCGGTQFTRDVAIAVSGVWHHGYVCEKCSHLYRKMLDSQPDPTVALANLLARIFGDGGQTQTRLGYAESLKRADDIVAHLNGLESSARRYVDAQHGPRAEATEAETNLTHFTARLRELRG